MKGHMIHFATVQRWRRRICTAIIVTLLVPNPVVYAVPVEVDPNAPAGNQASLDQAQNGVGIINIVAPTDGGLSNNHFRSYNVPDAGLILNNSTQAGVSNLGGAMLSNPNFTGQSASTILFQVTGGMPSNISGYQELFGD